jgi:PHP family Zn ribbon phosphoesterase
MTILDMHNHSVASDDARATVEQYAKWLTMLRGKGLEIDGFVLTEHRQFDSTADYSDLAEQYDLAIFNAAELDTDAGHFLVYGVSPELTEKFDFRNVTIHAEDLVEVAEKTGAIAVPAHIGRYNIGFCEFVSESRPFERVRVVEHLNGGSNAEETDRAMGMMAASSYTGIAGSDAHFVNRIGRYLTRFHDDVPTMQDIVAALKAGRVEAIVVDAGIASRTP